MTTYDVQMGMMLELSGKPIVFVTNDRDSCQRAIDMAACVAGGYEALGKAVTTMTPEGVVAEMKASGLRGRGGVGFPTGTKWDFVRREALPKKVVVCNADEGDNPERSWIAPFLREIRTP